MTRRARLPGVVLAVALSPAFGGAGMAVASAHVDPTRALAPALVWKDCEFGWGTKCATMRVPLDFDSPAGARVTLNLTKRPAAGPQPRLGTVFVNPGGPGVRATEFVDYAANHLGPTVTARYDVIGIDPRGVGKDSIMVCHNANPPPTATPEPFPGVLTDTNLVWRYAQWLRTGCEKDPNAIVGHMSTADTARDMDLVRQAVGESRLNYYGASYGTYLGVTYASMFPMRVGRMAFDGVVDPGAWATGGPGEASVPMTTRLRAAEGASTGLIAALRECDRLGVSRCAFAGSAESKWRQLVARARAGKLTTNGRRTSYPNLVQTTLGLMYEPTYSLLAQSLQGLWTENFRSGPRVGADLAGRMERAARRVNDHPYAAPVADRPIGPDSNDAFHGVSCADARNPSERLDWWRAGQAQDRQFPWFGSLWTWRSAACGNWPLVTKDDTWFAPFGGKTSGPILAVGNTYDPATPIHGARIVGRLFPKARVLTYNGWGHTAIGNSCVTGAFERLFATGALPAQGAVCRMDAPLFTRKHELAQS